MKKAKFLNKQLVFLLSALMILCNSIFPAHILAAANSSAKVTVALLGTSDVRGSLMGYDYYTDNTADGGMTRVATLIKQERAKYPNNILVDAGNAIQGTPLVNYYAGVNTDWIEADKPHPMIDVFNQLNYDAWVLGNHEFNFGLDFLQSVIRTANFPVLSANTQDRATGQTWEKVKPYTIKTFKTAQGDLRVGILGLSTPVIPSFEPPENYTGLQWADIVTDGSKWVLELKNVEKVDAIIAVIHSGLGTKDPSMEAIPYENEVLAFANANPDVTAILFGHTEIAFAEQIGINQIWTAQPGANGRNLAEIVMNFGKDSSGKWKVQNINGRSLEAAMVPDPQIPGSSKVTEDPEIIVLAQPYHQATLAYLQTKVGTATGAFTAEGQTVKDSALIDLINKVQMYYGHADLSVASPFNPTANIPAGDVTVGDISSLYTYENSLSTITINGAQLRRYLEYSVDNYYQQYKATDNKINKIATQPDYYLDILEGANYLIDLTKSGTINPDGSTKAGGESRITKLQYKGQDVKDDAIFSLALNSYRLSGGGGFLKAAGITVQTSDPQALGYITFDSQKEYGDDGQIRHLISRYFQEMAKQGQRVEPVVNNNWQTVPRFYDLVEVTDTHGYIDNNPSSGIPKTNAALLSGLVAKERQTYGTDRTLLLSGGDMMQEAVVSNVLRGKPVIDMMNLMDFEAMVLGNHDLDWGLDVLEERLQQAKFPFLAANMTLKAGDTDAQARQVMQALKPYVVIEKEGLNIGIIGVINPDTASTVLPAIVGHFDFQDPAARINQLVPEVKAAGADLIIVLARIGDQEGGYDAKNPSVTIPLSGDLAALAQKVSGVNAILGGHSHTINYDTVNGIPVVIGNKAGKGAAVVRLALDADNTVLGAVPGYLDLYDILYDTVSPDPAVQAIVDKAKQEIGPIMDEVIATATEDLPKVRITEMALGDWMADVIRGKAPEADFAFVNEGAVRISLPKGPITAGQIYNLLPFDNKLVTMDLSGKDVLAILEQGVSGQLGLIQVSGLKFSYDPNLPVYHRIASATTLNGTPIDPTLTYKIATNDFLGTGGDGYIAFKNGKNYTDTYVLVRDALINDLKDRKTLSNKIDGRASVVAAPTDDSRLRVIASALNLRTGPGMNYSIVGSLRKGTIVTLVSTEGDWKKIRYNDHTYFMYAQYLQPVGQIAGNATAMARSGLNMRTAAGLTGQINLTDWKTSYEK